MAGTVWDRDPPFTALPRASGFIVTKSGLAEGQSQEHSSDDWVSLFVQINCHGNEIDLRSEQGSH